jgi:hypothetical protein
VIDNPKYVSSEISFIFTSYTLHLAPRLIADLACAFFLTRASNHPIDYSAEECRTKRDQEALWIALPSTDSPPAYYSASPLFDFLTYPGISEITFFLRNIDYE